MVNINNMKDKISKIFIKWGLSTKQIAINEIVELFDEQRKKFEECVPEEDKPKLGSENQEIYVAYANGFNECRKQIIDNLDKI